MLSSVRSSRWDLPLIILAMGVLGLGEDLRAQAVFRNQPTANTDRQSGPSPSDVSDSQSLRMDVAWRRPLGSGYSGVAVAKDLAVTLFSDGSHDVVAAFDASDGQERWRYKLDDTYRGHDGSQDGPLSTPAIADGRIFALAPRGKLVALDASNGKPLWSSDLVGEHGAVKPHYGFTTSPLVAGGVLIVQAGAKEAMVIGLDPHSGKRMWAAGDDTVNYQSPILRREENADQVLAAGDEKLLCLEPHSGKVLWEYAHEGKGERGAPCMIPLVLDPTRVFLKHLDDGSRTIAISRRDGGAAIQSLWDTSSIGKTYAPAIASNGFLYGYSNRSLSCVDANTGKVAWRSREPGDGFIGLWGQRLVVVTKEGGVHLAKANPNSYEELTSLKVFPDLCWSPPTIADGSVFVRSLGELARITIRPGLAPARATRDSSEELAGTAFGKLLDQVRGAKDKPALIDPFLRSVPQFPIIESDGRVIFVYRGPAKDVELGGDVTGFGAMHRMIRVDDTDLFYCVERLERDARATYGFLCDYKAVSDPLNPRKLVNKWYDDELELAFDKPGHELSWFAMPDWKPAPHIAPVEESRRGRSERQTFRSNALDADVEIEVYLPNGYEKAEALPVVYVHDGPLARGQLMLPNTLDNLAGRRVAPVIAVFIDHQPPFFGDPEKYARMAAKELPAFIESKYRAIAQPEARTHIAFGVAGYAAMVTVLAHPDAARKLGVQSPFMTGASELRRYLSDPSRPPLTIYFGWCKYDLRNSLEGWSLVRAGREIDGFFREHGYHPLGGESPDGSDPEGWRNRTDDMLEALFPLKGN